MKNNRKVEFLNFLKSGNKIHIKKSHEGKFTSYCGGKVTDACIAKGKSSSDPKIRKQATFAQNARSWKHSNGGMIAKRDLGGLMGIASNFLNKEHNMGTNSDGSLATMSTGNMISSVANGVTDFIADLKKASAQRKIDAANKEAAIQSEADLNKMYTDAKDPELKRLILKLIELKKKGLDITNELLNLKKDITNIGNLNNTINESIQSIQNFKPQNPADLKGSGVGQKTTDGNGTGGTGDSLKTGSLAGTQSGQGLAGQGVSLIQAGLGLFGFGTQTTSDGTRYIDDPTKLMSVLVLKYGGIIKPNFNNKYKFINNLKNYE